MKAVLVIFLILIVLFGGAYLYLTHKLAYQPDWYHPEEAPAALEQAEQQFPVLEKKLNKQWREKDEVVLSSDELSTLITKRAREMKEQNLHKALKAVHSKVTPEKIEIEMIVDVEQLPKDQLPPAALKALDKITQFLPRKALNNLLVKIDAVPRQEGDQIVIGDDAQITIAGISMSVKEAMQRFNIPASSFSSVPIKDFQLGLNSITIKR